MLARRSFLLGLGSVLAAPAIVRAANIMPVKAMPAELLTVDPMVMMQSITTQVSDSAFVVVSSISNGPLIRTPIPARLPAGSIIHRIESTFDLSIGDMIQAIHASRPW
jgi:hypothetical protein